MWKTQKLLLNKCKLYVKKKQIWGIINIQIILYTKRAIKSVQTRVLIHDNLQKNKSHFLLNIISSTYLVIEKQSITNIEM